MAVKVARVVEQVGLEHRVFGVFVERWSTAYVDCRVVRRMVANDDASRINTIGRQTKRCVDGHVCGRKPNRATTLVALHDSAAHFVMSTEHFGGTAHVTTRECSTNRRAAHSFVDPVGARNQREW